MSDQDKKACVVRIWFEITDANGETSPYTVKPAARAEGEVAAYTMTKYASNRRVLLSSYRCVCDEEGHTYCDCPGFQSSNHCKHLATLSATGMLHPMELLEITGKQLMAEQLLADLEAQLAEAKKASKPRPRRKKQCDSTASPSPTPCATPSTGQSAA